MKIKESTKLLKLLFMLIMAIFFTACSDNDDFYDDINNRDSSSNSETYLTFSSQAEFDALVDQLKSEELNSESNSGIIRTYATANPNFVSLKDKLNKISKKEIVTYSDDDADEVEGVTPEEFFFQLKVDSLISEDFLTNVLNEDLTLGIAKKVYKITEYGTFIADKAVEDKLDDVIANFDKNKVTQTSNEGLYNVTEGIDIQDSYNYIAGIPEIEEEETSEIVTPDIETYAYSFSADPNVNSKSYKLLIPNTQV